MVPLLFGQLRTATIHCRPRRRCCSQSPSPSSRASSPGARADPISRTANSIQTDQLEGRSLIVEGDAFTWTTSFAKLRLIPYLTTDFPATTSPSEPLQRRSCDRGPSSPASVVPCDLVIRRRRSSGILENGAAREHCSRSSPGAVPGRCRRRNVGAISAKGGHFRSNVVIRSTDTEVSGSGYGWRTPSGSGSANRWSSMRVSQAPLGTTGYICPRCLRPGHPCRRKTMEPGEGCEEPAVFPVELTRRKVEDPSG
jgi:hypothetical protein